MSTVSSYLTFWFQNASFLIIKVFVSFFFPLFLFLFFLSPSFFLCQLLSISSCNSVQTFYQQILEGDGGENQLSKPDKAIWHRSNSYHF